MSFAREAVKKAIRDMAVAAVVPFGGFVWHFANQAGDIPASEFGTILIGDHEALGLPETKTFDNGAQIIERLTETIEIAVSMNAYGKSATDVLAAVRAHARRPSVEIGSASTVCLGFMSMGQIRDVSALSGGVHEHRAQADLRFSARFASEFVIDSIASVEIRGAESKQVVNLEAP